MVKKSVFCDRYSFESLAKGETDNDGHLFISSSGQFDARSIKVLHSGVDTVRQLYGGLIREDSYLYVQRVFESGHGEMVDLNGIPFIVSSGRYGGYRFILKNLDLGLVVLFKSNFIDEKLNGSHLKLELSPHFIHEHSTEEIQQFLDDWASEFLTQVVPVGVAVHLACDVQGIAVPDNFDQQLTARAKCSRLSGIKSLEFESLRDVAAVYGAGQSFLWGSVSALQFSVYRKDIEAAYRDKIHFWRSKWGTATDDFHFPDLIYDASKPVWRFEARFHHTVIEEFARGSGELELKKYSQLVQHLTGLWRYALNNFRWDSDTKYIKPEWQYLMQSVSFNQNPPDIMYRRQKKIPGECNARNVALALGNLISIYARNNYTFSYAWKSLQASGVFDDILGYFKLRHFGGDVKDLQAGDILAYVAEEFKKRLQKKILAGAAV